MKADSAGILLAGGRPSRTSGGKSPRMLAGRQILGHAADRLLPQGGIGAQHDWRSEACRRVRMPVLAEIIAGFAGPLAAILAGMGWTRDRLFRAA
jgi:molybdopterin-guanine dinucleotide biosynthesis protein A